MDMFPAELEAPEGRATFPPLPETADVAGAVRITGEYLAEVRVLLRTRQEAGAGGGELVATHTLAMDRLVCFLFAVATEHFTARYPRMNQRCAVVAQGGYGRGELSPCSDVDLLFLYPWKAGPYVETVAEVILYSLWDTPLEVGHAMRNVRECARLAARDLRVRTSLLDARFLCGDEDLYEEFARGMREEVWSKGAARFFRDKLQESKERHARYGDSVYLLEPNLKEGRGGLRDLHTALWMAKVKFRARSFRELVKLGVVSDRDLVELEISRDFLLRVRNALHLTTGRHQDQLTFDLQERLAPELGFCDGPQSRRVERFMRAYYRHAAVVTRFSDMVIERCLASRPPLRGRPPVARTIGEGLRIVGNRILVADADRLRREPAAVVRLFAEAQRHGVALSEATRALVRELAPQLAGRARRSPLAARALREICGGKARVYETLVEMHTLGVLGQLIPEFGRLDCLISRDPYHRYTVDQHSLMGVRELERLRDGEHARTAPLLTQVMRGVDKPELLVLAMLCHDVGKGFGHDHSARGGALVQRVARRLRLNRDEAEEFSFLVAHHLLMAELAEHRDIHDDRLVVEFCRTVGSISNLQKLYLLTFADMQAVGPGVWNGWRDMLLGELYVRALEVFERGAFVAEDRAARAERIKGRVAQAVPPEQRDGIGAFFREMPDHYFLATPEHAIPVHWDLVRRLRASEATGEPRLLATWVSHFPEREYSEFTVATRDRPGLFAVLAGVLAAHGMNVVGARIATSRDGVALDSFRVSHLDRAGAVLEPERWERIRATIEGALRGVVDVGALVEQRRRSPLAARSRRPAVPTSVTIDNQVSSTYTVLDVSTQDRIGLLYTITDCLYRLGMQIFLAKITTNVDRVLDVFYVTDAEGKKIEDEARLEAIRGELCARLAAAEGEGAQGGPVGRQGTEAEAPAQAAAQPAEGRAG